MDRPATRRIPLRRGHLELVAVGQRVDGLNEPLAERRRPEDQRAIVILERTGDDLRGRRRSAVDEHDERNLEREMLAARSKYFGRLASRTHAGDLLALAQEQARRL